MNHPRNILILTADAGFGHRSAANALEAAFQELHGGDCSVKVINPLEDKRTPSFLRDSQSDYDRIVRSVPELYRLGYTVSDAPIPVALFDSAMTLLLLDVMQDILKEHHPDLIITTYPLYQAPMISAIRLSRRRIPLYTVVTDLVTVHRSWFNTRVTGCFVPNEVVRDLAVAHGLHPERVHITGIPVHPDIARPPADIPALRAGLGLQPDLTTILAVGSRRVERLLDTLEVINHFGVPLQVVVVAGKDAELFASLQQMEWHIPNRLIEFTSDMPTLLHACDLVICKAGGLIVTESLACGRPMLLIDIIPGQETGNAEYVLENGAAELATSPLEALQTFSHLMMNDCHLLRERSRFARALGRPRAALDLVEHVWHSGAMSVPPRGSRRLARSRALEKLLGSPRRARPENPPPPPPQDTP